MRTLLLSLLTCTIVIADATTVQDPEIPTTTTDVQQVDPKIFSNSTDAELRLMLQSFLYSGDMKNAFIVASVGYKKDPTSYYWNTQMADIASWSGHPDIAINSKLFLYKRDKSSKLRDEIIKYGLGLYQYQKIEDLVIEKAIENPNTANIKMMISIENQIGTPEKAVTILKQEYAKDPTKSALLAQQLQLSMNLGDLKLTKSAIQDIQSKHAYTIQTAPIIAHYYYLKKDIPSAYHALMMVHPNPNNEKNTDEDTITYYQLLSDIGWYMQEYQIAAGASKFLIKIKNARVIDYARIIDMYEITDPKLSMQAAREAYTQYKLSYLFYSYAEAALKLKESSDLKKMITTIDNSNNDIKNEAKYWIVKAELAFLLHQKESALAYLDKAQLLGKNDINIQLSAFWLYLDNDLPQNAKMFMKKIIDKGDVDTNFYIPFASQYYEFGEIDKANYYLQKVLTLNNGMSQTIEFKFLEAYIYQAQHNDDGYRKKLFEIQKDLESKSKKNKSLLLRDDYWNFYLNAAMPTMGGDQFETLLRNNKKYLTPKNYEEISYSWAIQNNADEKSHKLYTHSRDKELWMQFSDALLFNNHTEIENLLNHHLENLSKSDAVRAAKEDGQIALAQSLNYKLLNQNSLSEDAYPEQIELFKQRGNEFNIQTSYYDRDPLIQEYVKINNKNYIADGYELSESLNYFHNDSLNKNVLTTLQANTVEADVQLKKTFDKNSVSLHVGYKQFIKNYLAYGISINTKPITGVEANFSFEKNMDTTETAQMVVAAKKDMIEADITWSILNSISLEVLYQKNYFSSQDNVLLGNGNYARISLSKQFGNSYPDIGLTLYADNGIYNETASSHGTIDTVQNGNFRVLPDNFYNIGGEFRYGMSRINSYSTAWKPYFAISPYYSSISGGLNIEVSAGYSGKVFHQDNLTLGASYSKDTLNNSIIEVFLKYQFLYTRY